MERLCEVHTSSRVFHLYCCSYSILLYKVRRKCKFENDIDNLHTKHDIHSRILQDRPAEDIHRNRILVDKLIYNSRTESEMKSWFIIFFSRLFGSSREKRFW